MAEVVRMVVVMRCPPTPCSPTARVVPGGLSKRDCKHKWARPHQYPTQQNNYFLLQRLDMHGNPTSYWDDTNSSLELALLESFLEELHINKIFQEWK